MSKFIFMGFVYLLSQGALAKSLNTNASNCADMLEPQAPILDYALSDLEGTFFDLVQKVQNFDEISPSRHEYLIKDILSMKANVLNQITNVLPMVIQSSKDHPKRARVLASIYQIIDTFGLPPAMYGLKLDAQSRVITPETPPFPTSETPAPEMSTPIGFLQANPTPRRDLPEGMYRSIGFSAHEISVSVPPARETGYIRRGMAKENPNIMIIADSETNNIYYIDIRIMTSSGAQVEGKKMQLNFSPEDREWIVLIENINNPVGRIGFL